MLDRILSDALKYKDLPKSKRREYKRIQEKEKRWWGKATQWAIWKQQKRIVWDRITGNSRKISQINNYRQAFTGIGNIVF